MNKPLNVGVVGAGYFGSFHARIYAAMPDVKLVGIADTNLAAAQTLAAKHKCPAFDDPLAFLNKADAVSVAVPTAHHREAAVPYLENGQAVLLEKPLAATMKDAHAIITAADIGGAFLLPGYLERFNPAFCQLTAMLEGVPYFMDFQRVGQFSPRANDVDVVTDLMIHDLDLALALAGTTGTQAIHALGATILTSHTDVVSARIEFDNGAVANFTASRLATKTLRTMQVFDRTHYYALDLARHRLRSHVPDYQRKKITTQSLAIEKARTLNAELAYFIRAQREGGKPLVSAAEALASLDLALKIGVQVRRHDEKMAG